MPEPLTWDGDDPATGEPLTWDEEGATWDSDEPPPPKPVTRKKRSKPKTPPPSNLPTMSDTYQYITRPTSAGTATTTQPVYRGTKTKDDLVAEIQARLGATPPTIDLILCTFSEIVIDWTTQGWKVAPCYDLIGFRLTTGGSAPTGGAESWDFDSMNIDLNCHWGATGEARSRALFASEKVGEQSRAAPVFVEVYDSETKEANHYEASKGLCMTFSNSRFEFVPLAGSKARFRKADGTFVDAAGYPFVRGKTVVCLPPAGLTGTVYVEVTALINGSLRTSEYPFALT